MTKSRIDRGISSIFQELVQQGEELDLEIANEERIRTKSERNIASLRRLRAKNQESQDAHKCESETRLAEEIAVQYQQTGRMQ